MEAKALEHYPQSTHLVFIPWLVVCLMLPLRLGIYDSAILNCALHTVVPIAIHCEESIE